MHAHDIASHPDRDDPKGQFEEVPLIGGDLVKTYIEEFQAFGKRTAEQVLGMASVLEKAHQKLGEADVRLFYSQVRLELESSKAKKLRKIAQERTRLELYVERLPGHWTTLYELACMEASEFEALIKSELLHPLATWDEIKDRAVKPTGASSAKLPRLVIDLGKISSKSDRREFAKKLQTLLKDYQVTPGKGLRATLETFISEGGTDE